MKKFAIIAGAVLVVASLVLLLASKLGFVFLVIGIALIVYGARKTKQEPKTEHMHITVAGTYFYKDQIFELKDGDDYVISDVCLRPEPDNEHDPNAIAVYITSTKVGYIPREKAADVKGLQIVRIYASIEEVDDAHEIQLDIVYTG